MRVQLLTTVYVLATLDYGQIHRFRLTKADGTSEVVWSLLMVIAPLTFLYYGIFLRREKSVIVGPGSS